MSALAALLILTAVCAIHVALFFLLVRAVRFLYLRYFPLFGSRLSSRISSDDNASSQELPRIGLRFQQPVSPAGSVLAFVSRKEPSLLRGAQQAAPVEKLCCQRAAQTCSGTLHDDVCKHLFSQNVFSSSSLSSSAAAVRARRNVCSASDAR